MRCWRRAFGATSLLFGATWLGCADETERGSELSVAHGDSAGISIVTISGDVADLPIWTVSESPVAEVSGEAPPYLGSVGEVEILSTGELLIEDNQTAELHLFDPSGAHVRVISGRGDGPGEFRNLRELSVAAGDTFWTYDGRHYRLSAFAPTGELIGEITLGRELAGSTSLAFDAWAIDSDHLVVYSIGPGDNGRPSGPARRDQRYAILHALNGAGEERVASVWFTGGYSIRGDHGDASSPFANRPFVSVRAGRVLHGSGLFYELTLRDASLVPSRIIRWSGWVQPLTETALEEARETFDRSLETLREAQPEIASTLFEALFSPDVLPGELPALSSAFLDDEGRMWVSRFRLLGDPFSEDDAWHVLDSDGTPLARVQLPPRVRLSDVRGDRVILVMRDSVDVEHVRVFALQDLGGTR